jgi:cobalamin 5'-phosphate synthase/cobalamin synthase
MLQKLFSGFALAFSMLSIIPFFKVHTFSRGINGYSVMFYPLVGFFLGWLLYGFTFVFEGIFPPFYLGILLFGLWVLITGALHLDGLADTIDGLFVSKERALEVMKDPYNGGMGMLFGVTFLILKAAALASLESYALLPLLLMLSRFGALLQIYFYRYLGGGIARLAKEEFAFVQLGVAFLYVTVGVSLFEASVLLFVSLVSSLGIGYMLVRRYGGLSGDMYGFSIELTELLLLNLLVAGVA